MISLLLSLALCGDVTASKTPVVRGLIHDQDGNPIPDAMIFLGYEECTPSTARSGPNGEFAIADMETPPSDTNYRELVVFKDGWCLGGTGIKDIRTAIEPFEFELQPSQEMKVRILAPDGTPVSDAVITPQYVDNERGYFFVGRAIGKRFSASSDREGFCQFPGLARLGGARLYVKHPDYGTQDMYFESAELVEWTLLPVGRIVGQVTAEEPSAVCDLEIQADSRPTGSHPSGATGEARVRTDQQGRFEIPALVAGKVTLSVQVKQDLPFRLSQGLPSIELEPGEAKKFNAALERGVRVHGSAIDADSGIPVAGAEIRLFRSGIDGFNVHTDDEGRYEAIVGAGDAVAYVRRFPLPYIYSSLRTEFTIGEESEPMTLEPFRLKKGIAISGIVRDESCNPVPYAWVGGSWGRRGDKPPVFADINVKADADGRFLLQPVAADVEQVRLFADAKTGASQECTFVTGGDTGPIEVRVHSAGVVPVQGRVIDTQGQPIHEAQVTLSDASRRMHNRFSPEGAAYGNQWRLLTDAHGRFVVPHPIRRNARLSIVVQATGMSFHEAGEIRLDADAAPAILPDVILRRESMIEGVVVDRQGNPISGVNIAANHESRRFMVEATSDDRGRFHLRNMNPDMPFVFFNGSGLRFLGRFRAKTDRPLTITMTRIGEPSETTCQLEEYRLSERHRRELLKKLLLPVFDRARRPDDADMRFMLLWYLASYDPQSVLDELRDDDSLELRTRALIALGRMEEALEVAVLMEDPYDRMSEFIRATDRETDIGTKQRLLAEALVHSRQTQDPSRRVVGLFYVAERLYDIGKKDAAKRLVDEAMVTARKLPRTGWNDHVRGALAGVAAPFDVESTFALLEGADGRLIEGFGAIANKLAAVDPQTAERALNMLPNESSYADYAPEVCGRMAATDLPRARDIASKMAKRYVYPYVFGVMARALSDSDPETARDLLRQAFVMCGEEGQSNFNRRSLFPYAIALVRVAEKVDPDSLHEYLWRAISQYPGPYYEADFETEELKEKAMLAILLAMYDFHPELRRYAMETVGEYLADLKPADYQFHDRFMITTMTLAAPDRAVEWHEAYLKKATSEDFPFHAYEHIAEVIAKPRHELWDKIQDDLRVGR